MMATASPIGMEALVRLFASSARAKVLRLFMTDPTRPYYQRQIEGATGLAIRAVQRELERLSAMGLLYRHTEGNRSYYQVDRLFPLFEDLRGMVLKACNAVDRLRGQITVDDAVRLAFLAGTEDRVLAVTWPGKEPGHVDEEMIAVEFLSTDKFLNMVAARAPELEPFLERGVDLFGRRDDVIWRRIEAAGYTVDKGKGVA